MNTIKWGIIGCGDVAERKSGPAFQQIEGSELLAVMRRNGAKAKDFAERHGVSEWYDQADAILHHPEINAVYIATPPSSHKDLAIQATGILLRTEVAQQGGKIPPWQACGFNPRLRESCCGLKSRSKGKDSPLAGVWL